MSGFSDAIEAKLLQHVVGAQEWPSPVANGLYLALCVAAVSDADTASTILEPDYTGYARKQVLPASWAAPVLGTMRNAVEIRFAECTDGGNVVLGWALVTSSAGAGDVVLYGTCAPITIDIDHTPAYVPAGVITLSLD